MDFFPYRTHLTASILESVPKDELTDLVIRNLRVKLPRASRREYAAVTSWNESKQAIYVLWLLEWEVNNGWFDQFYNNSSGKFYRHVPGSLDLIWAYEFARLCRKANEIYENLTGHSNGKSKWVARSYEDDCFDECDDAFYELNSITPLQELQTDYILDNKQDFEDTKKFLWF